MQRAIYIFRDDLRLSDNQGLTAACSAADQIIPVAIAPAPLTRCSASDWWRGQSLKALAAQLVAIGSRLVIAQEGELADLAKALSADKIIEGTSENLVCASGSIIKPDGNPYRVFTPFYKQWRSAVEEALQAPLPAPSQTKFMPANKLQGYGHDLVAPEPKWTNSLNTHWNGQPGEAGAQDQLTDFLDHSLTGYKAGRDMLDCTATSRLSPSLHHGEITPRQIIYACRMADPDSAASESFIRQLAWREFAAHVLHHFPHTQNQPMNQSYAKFPWRDDDAAQADFDKWRTGETGQDLVDAAMQELWRSGTMHNRARMIAASYLTKNLGIDWRMGASWFMHTLVDADTANNSLGWQWVAGCGTDAAPYFRIFNPDTQAKKFDPEGIYRSRWLGPNWRTRQTAPLVDLKASRAQALARYEEMKST